jgi:hypothetical protein
LCILKGSLRLKIIQELHNESHMGRDKTFRLVTNQFYWSSMLKEVARFVESCLIFQVPKGLAINDSLYMSLPIPNQPWTNVSMEFVLWLPRSQQGNNSYLCFLR